MSKKRSPRNGKKKSAGKKMANDILKVFFENEGKSLNYKQVSAKLNITDTSSRNEVIRQFGLLKAEGRIVEEDRGRFKLKHSKSYIVGRVDMTSSGAAYVISDDIEDDVYIPQNSVKNILDGDKVKVYLLARKRNKKPQGEIVEIIERKRTEFVGRLELTPGKGFGFVVTDNRNMPVDIYVAKEKLNNAQHGEKVIVKMTDWPEKASSPFGEITKVLGQPGEHNVEMHSILAEYGLPYEFPAEVEAFAADTPTEITKEEVAKRRDMRGVTTFTIDPEDAKDFDDALSVQKLKNGNWEIGVHIADVSHYVKPNTILDKEAYLRATSVYLVDRVVPMLPEILSNLVCSLRPNEEKLTFSAIFEIDENAEVKKQWFGRTVILSDRRFAYAEAQEVIETGKGDMQEEILLLDTLAKKMRNDRIKKGAITFDKIEVKFKLDEDANPIGVFFKESKDANKLIEEFMLLANKKVAEFIGKAKDGQPTNNTFVYRVHDDPDPEKLFMLSTFIKQFGYSIRTNTRKSTSDSINALLKEVHNKAEGNMIEQLAIRSMSKAVYTTSNIGHYGLGFQYYTHFTSPIRRYPDVMVHRLLQHYLDGGKSPNANEYEERCEHSSVMEKAATDAERSSVKYMQVKYMEDHIGEEFMGVISGVTEWGVYVELIDSKCEGMVKINSIRDDYYKYDPNNHCIVGEDTGKIYQLGDSVLIKVQNADLVRKQLDFVFAEN